MAATIEMVRQHALTLDQAKQRAEQIAKEMKTKFGIQYAWNGDTINVNAPAGMAKGANGSLSLSASDIRITLNLPPALALFKGTVENFLKSNIDNYLK